MQPMVFNRNADREMIEVLELVVREAQDLVNRVVEVAADPCGADPGGFRLQIKHLTDHARLPEQVAIEPGPIALKRLGIVGNHTQAEKPIGRNLLLATDPVADSPA